MFKFSGYRLYLGLIAFILFIFIGCGGGNTPDNVPTGPTPTAGPSGTITISGASPSNISTFYGENYWCWNSYGNYLLLQNIVTQATALHLNVLRAGGHNNDTQFATNFDPFTTSRVDEYVTYCRSIGAEPILQVSLLKNINNLPATAQDAADWVTYCNITKQYHIKYWEIGNEPDLYQGKDKTTYSVTDFCNDFKSYSQAMKAVDSTILILGPELSWKYPPQTGSNDWLTPFLQNCKGYFDIVSIHRYPFSSDQCTLSNALNDGANFRTFVRNIRTVINNQGLSTIPFAITEANISWDGDPAHSNMPASPQTFYAGLWLADSLGIALEENLWTMAYWSMCEGWTIGFIDSATKKPKSTYYAYQLYATHFGAKIIHPTSIPSGFSVYASRNAADNRTILIVINKNTTINQETIKFTGFGTSLKDQIYNFPDYSITCLDIPDNGGAMQIWSYTKTIADQGLAPQQIQ